MPTASDAPPLPDFLLAAMKGGATWRKCWRRMCLSRVAAHWGALVSDPDVRALCRVLLRTLDCVRNFIRPPTPGSVILSAVAGIGLLLVGSACLRPRKRAV